MNIKEYLQKKQYRNIPFGIFPQGAHGEIQKLLWRAIAIDSNENQVLLITEKCIDSRRYDEGYRGDHREVTWEVCTLRRWLNGEFFRYAFNEEEQKQIAEVLNQNPDNKYIEGGNPTRDKIFALSIDEAQQYFKQTDLYRSYDRRTQVTPYAKSRGSFTCEEWDDKNCFYVDGFGAWWLRSPGQFSTHAAQVDTNGKIVRSGLSTYYGKDVSVRPALWLKM